MAEIACYPSDLCHSDSPFDFGRENAARPAGEVFEIARFANANARAKRIGSKLGARLLA